MSKIVYLGTLSAKHLEKIHTTLPERWEIVHGKEEQWLPHLEGAEIIIGWNNKAAEACLKPNTRLKWIQNWGAGVDRMPLADMAAYGVALTNASGVHAYPISETIFSMMLAFARNLHQSIRNQERNDWKSTGALREIHGATMGVVGVGAIGEETARLGKAFGMTVLGVRRSGEQAPNVDRMFRHDGLGEVLRMSDFVVNTLPHTTETHRMFGKQQFAWMKPSAYYINIGRGGTTDTEAMIEALRSGEIAGAGLDVFEQEPLPKDSPLWGMDNVLITPHNSGSTVHYDDRALDIFLENLQAYLGTGQPSRNVVDIQKQY
ncbi:D-2-hydroxyacid dehydrogenase [Paenibacillus sp. HB172176]|uniref:D-2-hydroxyacid dehydrogenase n=1 Tax=Paenibacillus sp. HB172176 TaxID=2493690 RepID=UPI00143870D2|nr:D-2-hydroxyacid dehydrogenase [Paenibacillus sp. HB172176]